ncbi:N-acetylglucosamine kinase [Shimwellia pseudoproteus]|uniref:N-acetylglucosamine kinase n=1 Tax=Shimwellia pseudoproteus TaxID=570012 RepID=UPI0018ED3AD2|nr:N-acetylglucosamine kinase [Shimwellia pseudoproteus]MBJ3815463.1 N-acetylglucosamine kinase [Shimwellia pseudoproteus]
MHYGLDIGGSKIALGVYNAERELLWETRMPTPHDSYDHFIDAVVGLVRDADQRFGGCGTVGIGIPGIPVTEHGTLYAANLPAASGQPVQADLSARLARDVRMDNDANCFALSEAWDDEFCQYPVVLGIILGTGVGGGIIINGQPLTGQHFISGEFGHMRLPVDALQLLGWDTPLRRCGCGQQGCIETFLSGPGFAWLYHHSYGERLSAPQIIARYHQGEPQAQQHVDSYLEVLAICLANWLTMVDAHLVVIGGGLSQFATLIEGLPGRLPAYLLPVAKVPRIEQARYGDAGGMRGAAFLHLAR